MTAKTSPILWRPTTAPDHLRTLLTVKLPTGMKLPPSPQQFEAALFVKLDDLVEQAIAETDDRQMLAELVRDAVPGVSIYEDELESLADVLLMSDQVTAALGSIDWEKEPSVQPLLTKDDLEMLDEETLDDVLASL